MEKIVQPTIPFQPPSPPAPTRIILTDEEIEKLDKDALILKWKELESYVSYALEKPGAKAAEDKLQLQQQEATRRENVLMMRLATKEQEMQDLLTQVQELKQAQTPSAQQLQTMLIDPAVNLLFEKMKTELTETKDRLEQAQNDLSAWKFTPDSVTGKKLMAKCRTLIQENQELGKQLSQGRIAQLEAELALQKKYSEELKGSQDEMNEFVIQLDEEVEGMQATICVLQQQLKEAKQHSDKLGTENQKHRTRIEELLSSKQTTTTTTTTTVPHQQQPHHSSTSTTIMSGLEQQKMTEVRSPERCTTTLKQERTNHHHTGSDHVSPIGHHVTTTPGHVANTTSTKQQRDHHHHLSPSSKTTREHLSPSNNRVEPMEVDGNPGNKKDAHKSEIKKIDHKANSENRPPITKTVKVITRSISENLKNNACAVEPSNTSPYVSPPKGTSKSSFSITDLLSGGTDCVKKEAESPPPPSSKVTSSIELQTQENGENGALNGEIDDSVI